MRKSANPTDIALALPRMCWGAANLYNLVRRSTGTLANETRFTKSSLSLFQQRWKSKRLVRAYHGDWIQERRFMQDHLPAVLPSVPASGQSTSKVPLTSMMLVELEKRIDTVIFRSCFAQSVYKARQMVLHGRVKLNGIKHLDPNAKLRAGDLVTVEPAAITFLRAPGALAPAPEKRSEEAAAKEPSEDVEAKVEGYQPPAKELPPKPQAPAAEPQPRNLALPPFSAPFLFVPPYLEVSYNTCSVIYLRDPTAGPGSSEIATPYDADGEVMKLTWEWYVARGKRRHGRSRALLGKRLGA